MAMLRWKLGQLEKQAKVPGTYFKVWASGFVVRTTSQGGF